MIITNRTRVRIVKIRTDKGYTYGIMVMNKNEWEFVEVQFPEYFIFEDIPETKPIKWR